MGDVDLVGVAERVSVIVDRLLTEHPTLPGMAVAFLSADGTTASVAHGVADPGSGAPLTIDHGYRIASCTKSFVAAAVVSLVDDGIVALDDPLIEMLPAAAADLLARHGSGRSVTLRQVLQHRSGLVDHTLFPEFLRPAAYQWTPLEQIAIAADRPALFAPGAAFSYSDTGYVLIGQVVEHLTGRPLAVAVRERAAIDATATPSLHWELFEATPVGFQLAHQLYEGHDTHDWSPTFDLFGGGGLASTLPDLCRWWSSWFAGAHGNVAAHISASAPAIHLDGTPFPGGDRVGLGVFGREVDGHEVWSHGGFWGLQTGYVSGVGVSYALSLTHRAPDVPAASAVANEVVAALVRS